MSRNILLSCSLIINLNLYNTQLFSWFQSVMWILIVPQTEFAYRLDVKIYA